MCPFFPVISDSFYSFSADDPTPSVTVNTETIREDLLHFPSYRYSNLSASILTFSAFFSVKIKRLSFFLSWAILTLDTCIFSFSQYLASVVISLVYKAPNFTFCSLFMPVHQQTLVFSTLKKNPF